MHSSAGLIVYIKRSAQDVSGSLTAGCVICGQVRLLWPGRPHTAQVLGTPMALSERACRASWSELMRFIDSAMRLLTAHRPVKSGGHHGEEHEAFYDVSGNARAPGMYTSPAHGLSSLRLQAACAGCICHLHSRGQPQRCAVQCP